MTNARDTGMGAQAGPAPGGKLHDINGATGPVSLFRLPAGARQGIDADGVVCYHLRIGCLLVDVTLPGDRRHVHLLHYPGDTVIPQTLPPAVDISMQAMNDCEIERVTTADLGPIAALEGKARTAHTYPADIIARSAIHSAAIGRLSGEERLATLILEMSLYLGYDAPGGRVFDQPLARRDIADLLGLNPDTLSRLVTRLRTDGIISVPTRSRMIVHDTAALAALTPLAAAVQALYRRTQLPEAA